MSEQVTQHIPLTDIHADAGFNCRGDIAPIDVHDLAMDIKERGLIQPVVVAPYPPEKVIETSCKYRLIAGFRRYKAHQVIQLKTIFTIVRPDLVNETEARLLNLTENTQRKELNVLQEARAISSLILLGINEFEIAKRLGKSRGWVQVRSILLKLPKEVHEEAAAGIINQTQIRELYTIYLRDGKDIMFAAIKRVKHSKERGKKSITLNPNKTNLNVKKRRERVEINQMIERMIENDMVGLHTRALAWTAGQITTAELYTDMEKYARENDSMFIAPSSL